VFEILKKNKILKRFYFWTPSKKNNVLDQKNTRPPEVPGGGKAGEENNPR